MTKSDMLGNYINGFEKRATGRASEKTKSMSERVKNTTTDILGEALSGAGIGAGIGAGLYGGLSAVTDLPRTRNMSARDRMNYIIPAALVNAGIGVYQGSSYGGLFGTLAGIKKVRRDRAEIETQPIGSVKKHVLQGMGAGALLTPLAARRRGYMNLYSLLVNSLAGGLGGLAVGKYRNQVNE